MKEIVKNSVKRVFNIEKFCTFALIVPAKPLNNAQIGRSFQKKVLLTQDNTPSRLTSVAHLGGFLFYKLMVA